MDDRLPGESAAAYAAFCVYRNLGPQRSIMKAIRAAGGKTAAKQRQFEAWSSKYRWVSRAAAWDAETDQAVKAAIQDGQTTVAEKALDLMLAVLDRLDPDQVTPLVAVRLLDVVARIARLESGQATVIAENRHDDPYDAILRRLEAEAQASAATTPVTRQAIYSDRHD